MTGIDAAGDDTFLHRFFFRLLFSVVVVVCFRFTLGFTMVGVDFVDVGVLVVLVLVSVVVVVVVDIIVDVVDDVTDLLLALASTVVVTTRDGDDDRFLGKEEEELTRVTGVSSFSSFEMINQIT